MDINEYMKKNKKIIKLAFKSLLVDLRKNSGLTQQSIADYLNIDISKIRNYEYLKIDSFDITIFYFLKFILNTPSHFIDAIINKKKEERQKIIISALQATRINSNTKIETIADRYGVPNSYLYLFEDGIISDEYPLIMYIDYLFLGGNEYAK